VFSGTTGVVVRYVTAIVYPVGTASVRPLKMAKPGAFVRNRIFVFGESKRCAISAES